MLEVSTLVLKICTQIKVEILPRPDFCPCVSTHNHLFGYFRTPRGEKNLVFRTTSNKKRTFCGVFLVFVFNIFIYSFERRDSERASTNRWMDRERGRSRLPTEQGAQCGARSQDPGIMTWAKGRRLTHWITQAPQGNDKVIEEHMGSKNHCVCVRTI